MAAWFRHLCAADASPPRLAAAVFVGVVIGCTPLFGLHLVLCVAAGLALRLNLVAMYAGANVSNPFLAPVLAFASLRVGEWARGQTFSFTWAALREIPATELAHHYFSSWLIGGLVVGAGLGVPLGSIVYAVARARPPRPDHYMPLAERAFARYVGAPRQHYWYLRTKALIDPLYEEVLRELEPHHDVTDLGSGLGFVAALLQARGHQGSLSAIEWDSTKALTARRCIGLNPTVADLFASPLPDTDVVLLLDVLHYRPIADQDALLTRAWQAIRPGGKLIVRDLDAARRSLVTQWVERWGIRRGWNRADHAFFRTAASLQGQLEGLGGHVVARTVDAPGLRGNVLFVACKVS